MAFIAALLKMSVFFIFVFCAYFIGLESWRRNKCKIGAHAGYIKDGKLVCHTCMKEISYKG